MQYKGHENICNRELTELDLKTIEAFFLSETFESLDLFHAKKTFLRVEYSYKSLSCPTTPHKFSHSKELSYGPLFIQKLRHYFPTRRAFNRDWLEFALEQLHSSDLEASATSAYLCRYACSAYFDSVFSKLVTLCTEESRNTLVKLCSIDSIFFWIKGDGENFYSRMFLFLNYVIPTLVLQQPVIIRYFVLKHLLLLVDTFISSNIKPLSLHQSFMLVALKVCNDPCCIIRHLGLELLLKLLFQPSFLILRAFQRKNIKPEILSCFCNALLIPSPWDNLHSLLQKLKLHHNKGLVVLEVAGSLIQLAEDPCLHIRLSFICVMQLVLSYNITNKTLTDYVVDCLTSLLYDPSSLIRIKALNLLTVYASDLCFRNRSLEKLLINLLDPNVIFRYSVAFLLSQIFLAGDCNLDCIFKYYLNAFEFFPEDLPILIWSIERLGIRNPFLVRKGVVDFSQFINKSFSNKWKVTDPVERNILYIHEQPKLLLIYKFFLSSKEEQVIERLPRVYVLLFDIRRRKWEESHLQQCLAEGKFRFANICLPSIVSCLSFHLGLFGYQCLYYGYNCFHPKYRYLLRQYIRYLDQLGDTNYSACCTTRIAKCLLEWLQVFPRNVCVQVDSNATPWRNALLDAIVTLELFQSPHKYIEHLSKVLQTVYEASSFSHLARDYYRAVEHYFLHGRIHLRPVRYVFRIVSFNSYRIWDISHRIVLELLFGISVQNLEVERIPSLFIRIYSHKDANCPLIPPQRLEICEQYLKQGRTLVSETCELRLEADDSTREGFVSLETILYEKTVFLAPLQLIHW